MKRGKAEHESTLSVSDENEKSGSLGGVVKEKVSRRTFLKGGVAAGAFVGLGAAGAATSSLAVTTTTQTTSSDPFAVQHITLNVNGTNYAVPAEPRDMLLDVLRLNLGLIATKSACNRMECGACTVLIDGVPTESCGIPAIRVADGQKIQTAEGFATDPVIAALEDAWVPADGGQCSYCGPGNVMAATALLKKNNNPSVNDIKSALAGHLCRCGNYVNIINAVQLAAQNLNGGS